MKGFLFTRCTVSPTGLSKTNFIPLIAFGTCFSELHGRAEEIPLIMIVDGEGRGMAGFNQLDIWGKKEKA